jgi:hypothetical protein
LNALITDRIELENHISGLIQGDERLKQLMALVSSVHCIGPVTALQIIVSTNEFIDINNPKKFACYVEILMNVTTPFRRKLTTHSGRN